MNQSNSLSHHQSPPHDDTSESDPPSESKPGPTSNPPNIIYVQHFASANNKPTHETSWSTSMYGCFSDMNTCVVTACCPCITSGRIAEIVDEGKTSCVEGVIMYALFSLFCINCIYTGNNRSKMRKQHMLKGNDCHDCLVHTYCTACALCQEYRELYRLGLDPGIGWHENLERQKHAVAVFKITPPRVEGGMMR
ncbi:OLC1v1028215C1 [Oldenlandia corymbosa var. corymbosa]|uniref:OLC1v1028215C1 n=1 Tax=Oldenlandia corymbosa var. corymbosa TaxID=529605 RepID=A0AAV1CBS1_OLDCO|nr:OLC1v1028215C1 [Oldenlandia corymbosa var. corymbosa]